MNQLTYEEFWKLPESERGEAYRRLSDHDKFRVRIGMRTDNGKSVPANSPPSEEGLRLCEEVRRDLIKQGRIKE